MKYPNQPPGGLASVISKFIKPLPVVPLTRSDYAKAHNRTTNYLRDSLNARHPSSNPSLKDHFTNLGAVSGLLSSDSIGNHPPTAFDLHRQHLTRLSTSSHPMSHYVKLKSSGELTKDACRAILFNSNLTSYEDINTIATENCIPASYLVAKFMKLPNRMEAVSEWMAKVPPTDALFEYIRHLDRSRHVVTRKLHAEEDFRASLRQCQMDLTAHISYTLSTDGTLKGFTMWKHWTGHGTNGLSPETRALVLQLPTLRVLKQAMLPPIQLRVLRSIVRRSDIELPSQDTFRRQLVSLLMSNSSQTCNLETAMTVMDTCRNSFDSYELGEYTHQMVREWMHRSTAQAKSLNVKWVNSFLEKSIQNCRDAEFETRVKLARVRAELEEYDRNQGMPTEPRLMFA